MKTKEEVYELRNDLLRESHDTIQTLLEDMSRMISNKYGLDPMKYSTYIEGRDTLKKIKEHYALD